MIRLLTNEFYPRTGGIATYSLELAKALAAHGEEIVVSCPDFPDQPPPMPFTWARFKSRGTQDPDDLWRLGRLIQSHCRTMTGTTLLITEPAPLRSLLLFQRFIDLSATPLWITFHGSELAQLSRNRFWKKRLRKLIPRVSRVIANSCFTRTLLLKEFPGLKDRVTLVQPAVSEEWKRALATRQKRSDDEIRILTVARIHPRKGQVEVIKALSSIKLESGNLRYQIVGEARRRIWLNNLETARSACPYPVEVSGELKGKALQNAYSGADIFVMASQPDPRSIESFGIVYLEAAAAGLPIIAADVGGVREAVEDGKNAILVPPGDNKALEKALLELIHNPEKRRQMGEAGRAFVERFSWLNNTRSLLT